MFKYALQNVYQNSTGLMKIKLVSFWSHSFFCFSTLLLYQSVLSLHVHICGTVDNDTWFFSFSVCLFMHCDRTIYIWENYNVHFGACG